MSRAVLAIAWVAAIGTAHAEPDQAARRRAGELAAEAAEHYKSGELESAAALLRQAFGLYPEPKLMYNLARSLEGMGDKSGAVEAYERYLATGINIEDRGAIERRIATLKADLGHTPTPTEPTPKEPTPEEPAPEEPTSTHVPPPGPAAAAVAPVLVVAPAPVGDERPSAAPWIVIGLGAAALAAGGGCAYYAEHLHDEATSASSGLRAQSLQNSGQRYLDAATVLLIAGGAVALGGIVWEIHEHGKTHRDVTARALIAPGAAGFAVSW
jgi:tetratricopeptide (TPR) repeat protein